MGYKFIARQGAGYKIQNGIIIGDLKNGDPQLSPHFKAHEFACPCCGLYKISIRVLEGVENVRVAAGVPLEITSAGGSGYRCPRHNAELCRSNPNASPHSRHMSGFAVDVHPTGALTVTQLYKLMDAEPVFHNGGLGKYKTFIHGDCWTKRRWTA